MSSDAVTSQHSIDDVYQEVAALRDLFARRLMDDKMKNAMIEKLSQSNSSLIKATENRLSEGIIRELLLVCDRIYEQPTSNDFAYSILDELLEILSRRGIEQISQLDDFDPKLHSATSTVQSTEEYPAGTIVEVVRHGYRTEDKVLRPADVIVSSNH